MNGTFYYADCDEYDDSRTSWHRTEAGAIETFWMENTFSKSERERVSVYVRSVTDPTEGEWEEERQHAEEEGLISVTRKELAQYAN